MYSEWIFCEEYKIKAKLNEQQMTGDAGFNAGKIQDNLKHTLRARCIMISCAQICSGNCIDQTLM